MFQVNPECFDLFLAHRFLDLLFLALRIFRLSNFSMRLLLLRFYIKFTITKQRFACLRTGLLALRRICLHCARICLLAHGFACTAHGFACSCIGLLALRRDVLACTAQGPCTSSLTI